MPYQQRRSQLPTRWFFTLRTRLTLWHTLVVLIAVCSALLAVREGLRYYLLLESDVVLNDEARELTLAIQRWHPNQEQIIAEMQQKAAGHSERGWHIRWLAEDRRHTIWASSDAPQGPLSKLAARYRDYSVWYSDTMRSVERQVKAPGIPAYYVRVGTPTQFIANDIGRLTRIAGPVALAIVLLAPLGGYFLSERAVRPLQNIIRTTDRLRPSHLEERLPVRGIGDELDQLASKINEFLDEIAIHLRQHQDFVANAAHELRSPLAAILSSVEVTIGKPRTPAEYQELLGSIEGECLHLTQLVNQLLQLAESESRAQPQVRLPVALDEIVRKSIEMFGPVAEENQVQLQFQNDVPITISGDHQQLRQLVTNLIDNAIKFTNPGGSVIVRFDLHPDVRQVTMTVQDTGIGIPAEELGRIFERFYQVDRARSRTSGRRGNGLGLSICASIVQHHRGTIRVESETGKGTTFIIEFPLATNNSPVTDA